MKKNLLAALFALFILTGGQAYASIPIDKGTVVAIDNDTIAFNFATEKDKPWFGEPKSQPGVFFSKKIDLTYIGNDLQLRSKTLSEKIMKPMAYQSGGEYKKDSNKKYAIDVNIVATKKDGVWVKGSYYTEKTTMSGVSNANVSGSMSTSTSAGVNGIAAATILLELGAAKTQNIYEIKVTSVDGTEEEVFFALVIAKDILQDYALGVALNVELNK